MNKPIKICFAASTGGHFEQLMMLKPLMDKYDSFILTEETQYETNTKGIKTYYFKQVNRKEITCIPRMIVNIFKSFKIYLEEKPDLIITTGVLSMLPMCIWMKLNKKKNYLYRIFCEGNITNYEW